MNSIFEKIKETSKVISPQFVEITSIIGIAMVAKMFAGIQSMDISDKEPIDDSDCNRKIYENVNESIDKKIKQIRANNSKPIYKYQEACDRYYSWMSQSNTKEIYEAYEEYKEFGN